MFAKEAQVLENEGAAAQVFSGREAGRAHRSPGIRTDVCVGRRGDSGWWLAQRAYKHADKGYEEPIKEVSPRFYKTLFRKYYVDEIYDWVFTGRAKLGPVRLGMLGLGEGLWKFDADVIDGTVNGAGWTTRMSGTLSTLWDKWIIDGLFVNGVAIVTRLASYPVRLIQWGLVQWYALVMVAGLVCFIFYYVVKW